MPKNLDSFVTKLPPSLDLKASTQFVSTKGFKPFPISQYVSYENNFKAHHTFLTSISNNNEPKHFAQAARDPRWREAMKKEIEALEEMILRF